MLKHVEVTKAGHRSLAPPWAGHQLRPVAPVLGPLGQTTYHPRRIEGVAEWRSRSERLWDVRVGHCARCWVCYMMIFSL